MQEVNVTAVNPRPAITINGRKLVACMNMGAAYVLETELGVNVPEFIDKVCARKKGDIAPVVMMAYALTQVENENPPTMREIKSLPLEELAQISPTLIQAFFAGVMPFAGKGQAVPVSVGGVRGSRKTGSKKSRRR